MVTALLPVLIEVYTRTRNISVVQRRYYSKGGRALRFRGIVSWTRPRVDFEMEYLEVDVDEKNAIIIDGTPLSHGNRSKRSSRLVGIICSLVIGCICGSLGMLLFVGKWHDSSAPTSFGYEVDDGIASKNHNSSGNYWPLNTGSGGAPVTTEGKLEDELPQISMSENEIEVESHNTEIFVVLEEVKHDRSSFTQGLSYADDKNIIFQTTGINGESKVQRINPITFDVELSVDVDSQYFGEGSAFYRDAEGNGRLIHITWQTQTGFIYDADTLDTLKEFKYTTTPPQNEGWGITYNPSSEEFIVSDGSKFLYFWDRDTLIEKRKVSVTRLDGRDQDQMNELEYVDGLVCCNIWYDNHIICVDPVSGKSVREYDMSSLSPENLALGVLNGIALGKDHVLITGKNWDQMFKVVFPDWKNMFNVKG